MQVERDEVVEFMRSMGYSKMTRVSAAGVDIAFVQYGEPDVSMEQACQWYTYHKGGAIVEGQRNMVGQYAAMMVALEQLNYSLERLQDALEMLAFKYSGEAMQ